MTGKVGAPKGSMNREKYKTDEEKIALFNAVCEHLRNGYDQERFPECDWETVERYCEKYPEIFDKDEISKARRTGHHLIEKMLMASASGASKMKGNPASLIFMVKNKIGYRDKLQLTGDPTEPLFTGEIPAAKAEEYYKKAMAKKGL